MKILPIFILLLMIPLVSALNVTDPDLMFFLVQNDSGAFIQDHKNNSKPLLSGSYNGALNQRHSISPFSSFSLGFDGTDDQVVNNSNTTGDLFNTVKQGTIMMWVDFGDPVSGTDEDLISIDDGTFTESTRYYIESTGAGVLKFDSVTGGGTFQTVAQSLSDYNNLKGTFITVMTNNTHITFYINATRDGQALWSSGSQTEWGTASDSRYSIGDNAGVLSKAFNGNISDVAVFNRSLTEAEILDAFQNGIEFISSTVPIVNITAPIDNFFNNFSLNQNISFNLTDIEPSICWLFANDTGSFEIKDLISVNGTFNVTSSENISTSVLNFTGVINYFDFEEGSGTVAIDQANQNNGTINGSVYTSSKGGNRTGSNALAFTTDFVQIPNTNFSIGTDLDISISLWFRSTHASDGDYHFIYDKRDAGNDGLFLAITSADTLQTLLNTKEMQSATTITDTEWHHIVIVWDRDDASISDMYIDNVSENIGIITSSEDVQTDSDIFIGRRSFTAGLYWEGDLDELIIFNSTLSQANVSHIYEQSIYFNTTVTVTNTTVFNFTINSSLPQNLTWDFISNTYKVADYFIQCLANDINTTSQTQTLTYQTDLTFPIITLEFPDQNEALNESVVLNISINENVSCVQNGTLFSTAFSNATFNSYTETLLPNGDFVINVQCTDIAFQTTSLNINFTKDTLQPVITWTFPNDGDTSQAVKNATATLIVSATDLNLFAVSCLLFDQNSVQQFNFTQENLPSSNFELQEDFIPGTLGNWTAQCTFSDSHTEKDFKKPREKKNMDDDKITFEILKEQTKNNKISKQKKNVSIQYTGRYKLDDIITDHIKDRTKFQFNYELSGYNAPTIAHSYKLECDNLHYIPFEVSGYQAHFVCYDSFTWVDFENPDVISYEVFECGKDCWEIETISTTNEQVPFNSIGGLNFNTEIHTFEVVGEIIETDLFDFSIADSCPDTLPQIFLYGFILLIIGILIFVSHQFLRVGFFTGLLAIFLGTIFGMMLIPCSQLIGGFIILVSFLLGFVLALSE